jgi:prepilin-type N-terminal cleavage/methylation domain-containing protein
MRKTGFSLIEVLVAIMLVGIAIVSLVGANRVFTQANGSGAELSTAEFLAEQIRELTATLPVVDPQGGTAVFGPEEPGLASYDDLDDFDGASFCPPVAADRTVLNDFAAYRQDIIVQNVGQSNFDQVVTDHVSNFVRVTVSVSLNGRRISSAIWIRARY